MQKSVCWGRKFASVQKYSIHRYCSFIYITCTQGDPEMFGKSLTKTWFQQNHKIAQTFIVYVWYSLQCCSRQSKNCLLQMEKSSVVLLFWLSYQIHMYIWPLVTMNQCISHAIMILAYVFNFENELCNVQDLFLVNSFGYDLLLEYCE